MDEDNDPSRDALLAALHQNWEHARHVEVQRFWFGSVYAAIVAGVVVVMDKSSRVDVIVMTLFLIALTVSGLVVTLKTGLVFHHFKAHATRISRELAIGNAIAESLYQHTNPAVRTPIVLSVGPMFLVAQLLGLSVMSGFLVYTTILRNYSPAIRYIVALLFGATVFTLTLIVIFKYARMKMGAINEHVANLVFEGRCHKQSEQTTLKDY